MKITVSAANGSMSKTYSSAGYTYCDLGIKIINKKTNISCDNEGVYRFCFSGISLKPGEILIISASDNRQYTVLKGAKISDALPNRECYTKPMRGKDFTLSFIGCSETENKSHVILKAMSSMPVMLASGGDENGQISSEELKALDAPAYAASRAVARVDIATSHGTGWMLGKSNYIVSNAHVLGAWGTEEGAYVGSSLFLWDSGDITNSLSIDNGELLKIGDYVFDDYNNISNTDNDFAIATIDPFDLKYSRLAEIIGGLALNTHSENDAIGETLFMPNHGGADILKTSYYSDIDGGKRCSIIDTISQQLDCDYYSIPGSSGSPVISANTLNVMGIDWGRRDSAPAGIFNAVKGSRIWSALEAFVTSENNVNVTGLAAKYDISRGQLLFTKDEVWHTLCPYSDNITFSEFSGNLSSHADGYTLFRCKALSNDLSEYIVDMVFRLAQKTDSGLINLETSGGEGNKELQICYCAEDNPDLAQRDEYHYHSWVGLEAILAGSQSIKSYFIFSVDLHSN